MSLEIERKFLVIGDGWRASATRGQRHRQGYLSKGPQGSIRVRRAGAGAAIAVKGPRIGIARQEFEFPIPPRQADEMLELLCARPLIEKVRHCVDHAGMTWEVDVYAGLGKGLVLAEIELDHPDQAFALPPWAGPEVTHDARFRNWSVARGRWRGAACFRPSAVDLQPGRAPARRPAGALSLVT
jgi:adenylate cyclase